VHNFANLAARFLHMPRYDGLTLSISIRIYESDKCKRDVIPRKKERSTRARAREREREREREEIWRVIGSAGVDAILSSIPHQPPPGNLYPSPSVSLSHAFTPHTRHRPFSCSPPLRPEYQAVVSSEDGNGGELVNDSPRVAQMTFKDPPEIILAHRKRSHSISDAPNAREIDGSEAFERGRLLLSREKRVSRSTRNVRGEKSLWETG